MPRFSICPQSFSFSNLVSHVHFFTNCQKCVYCFPLKMVSIHVQSTESNSVCRLVACPPFCHNPKFFSSVQHHSRAFFRLSHSFFFLVISLQNLAYGIKEGVLVVVVVGGLYHRFFGVLFLWKFAFEYFCKIVRGSSVIVNFLVL